MPCGSPVDIRQLAVKGGFFLREFPFRDAALFQQRNSVHVLRALVLHTGDAVLVKFLCRGEGLHIGKGIIKLFPFLLPHIEDGALFHQAGQRFLRAGTVGL